MNRLLALVLGAALAASVGCPGEPTDPPPPTPTTDEDAQARKATDVVCGMEVAVADDTPRAEHGGETYFFCAEHCREEFVEQPASYLAEAGAAPDGDAAAGDGASVGEPPESGGDGSAASPEPAATGD